MTAGDRKDHEDEDQFERILREHVGGDVPAALERRLDATFDGFRRGLGARGPGITTTMRPALGARFRKGVRTMKQSHKLALAAAIVLAAIGIVSWLTPDGGGGNGLAFADVREEVGRIESLKYTYTRIRQGEEPTATRVMYLAPGRGRVVEPGGKVQITDYVSGKTLILHPDKMEAHLYDVPLGANVDIGSLSVNIVETIEEATDGSEEVLGERLLDGRKTVCFVLRGNYIDMTVWADPDTRRPVRVEAKGVDDWGWLKWVVKDIAYNVELDESLFSLEAPAGYTSATKNASAHAYGPNGG